MKKLILLVLLVGCKPSPKKQLDEIYRRETIMNEYWLSMNDLNKQGIIKDYELRKITDSIKPKQDSLKQIADSLTVIVEGQ